MGLDQGCAGALDFRNEHKRMMDNIEGIDGVGHQAGREGGMPPNVF